MENADQKTPYQESINQNNSKQFWQQQLPHSGTVLVLGIISIITSFWLGFIGLTLGIIALILAAKSEKLYRDNPSLYSVFSYSNMKAGKICAIIGTCLSAIYLFIVIIFFAFITSFFSSVPWNTLGGH